jgi:hypothetical protein
MMAHLLRGPCVDRGVRTLPALIGVLIAAAFPLAAAAQDPAPQPPLATTGAAQAIGQATATLIGTVDPNGSPTTYSVEYGTSTAYGLQTSEQAAGDGDAATDISAPVTALTPATTYHYRLVATNAAGVSRGADRSFTTAATPANPRPPSASTASARSVGPRGATLRATVDPNGSQTTVRFEYGTSTNYGKTTAAQGAGAGDRGVSVSRVVGGLRPNTRYHYRVIAINAAGTARGGDRAFTTVRQPTGATIVLDPAKVVWGRALTVTGRLSGNGVSGAPVALERQEFPFSSAFAQVGSASTARSDGSFRFTIGALFATTRLRVVTRTQVVVASPVVTASSALRVGARALRLSPRRARIQGAVWPAVARGRASLQKRSPSGKWVLVRRASVRAFDTIRSRYRFTLRRGRKTATYRVVVLARDGGAHVPGTSRAVRVRGRVR